MRYQPIPSKLFVERRHAFIKKMKPDAVAIFYSNESMPRSGDQSFPFRQDNALFAMSGLDQPGTIIVLNPQARKKSQQEMVFILKHDPDHAIWNGDRLTEKEAGIISGISFVATIDLWDRIMPSIIQAASTIYVNTKELDRSHPEAQSPHDRMAIDLKKSYPAQSFLRQIQSFDNNSWSSIL